MRSNRVRRVPIVRDGGRITGIVSLNDIALEASRERSRGVQRVTAGEVLETLAVICEHPGSTAHA